LAEAKKLQNPDQSASTLFSTKFHTNVTILLSDSDCFTMVEEKIENCPAKKVKTGSISYYSVLTIVSHHG
jgi:hypothetical protein